MLLRSWPVRFLITRAARAYGFLDPLKLVAKIRGFAEPSEFAEPLELLRAGMLFHARGLVNTKAIQHNLDWIWPYWVERQFNPADESFIPRAFSFSHINLTHRNWTAVGLPDVPFYPIVDPRGLVTPHFDGWSLDFWLLPDQGEVQVPSRLADPAFRQTLEVEAHLHVVSKGTWPDGRELGTTVRLGLEGQEPFCGITLRAGPRTEGHLAVALRPYNPEGISFVEKVACRSGGWLVNGQHPVDFDRAPDRTVLSVYREGDAAQRLREPAGDRAEVTDPVGLATAVALFDLRSLAGAPLEVRVPIYDELTPRRRPVVSGRPAWAAALEPLARLRVADARVQGLYDRAVAGIVLGTPDEAYPGPYTYKRFWFRDAAFMLQALLALGDVERARRVLRHFAPRQRRDGYFLSQEGEWDSNGEALWSYHRFAALTGETLPDSWMEAVRAGARWITRKRLPRDSSRPEAGLLPAGFSAEHLGPNDYYYWDDFWAVAGLRCAADLLQRSQPALARACAAEADEFLATIARSFPSGPHRRFPGAIPAAPRRRMDSGAVGSLVADYPLQLFPPADHRILCTVDYLREHSSHCGGFFQNMIHSGINAYLTLHLAQVCLRAGDAAEALRLLDVVAGLASPTGQWPEAIHPRTGGGCMGDGQHLWAAADWAMLVRNCFLREEGGRLIVGSGVPPHWWQGTGAEFGPTLTPHGAVTVRIAARGEQVVVQVDGRWRGDPPPLEFRVPGYGVEQRDGAEQVACTLSVLK